ncbi:hypothetical protein JB92DRAFT_2953983 [Gautieria morchelliformis]|nr:hypothetical protein JB92DRAFT_2953983 [Gautieria morchelliformis]
MILDPDTHSYRFLSHHGDRTTKWDIEACSPNFDGTWNNNVGWHEQVLKIVPANAVGWGHGTLSEAEFSKFGNDDILEQLCTVFKGCKNRYKRQWKEEDENVTDEKENRHDGRKSRVSACLVSIIRQLHNCHTQKAMARREVRVQVPNLEGSKFDWMFIPQYQSRDESQWEDVLSENTDEETAQKAIVPQI